MHKGNLCGLRSSIDLPPLFLFATAHNPHDSWMPGGAAPGKFSITSSSLEPAGSSISFTVLLNLVFIVDGILLSVMWALLNVQVIVFMNGDQEGR